jgi:hypothetical protein
MKITSPDVAPLHRPSPSQRFRRITGHTTESGKAPDDIIISADARSLPGIARQTAPQDAIRPHILRRYAAFVDNSVTLTDQNILSTVSRSLIT